MGIIQEAFKHYKQMAALNDKYVQLELTALQNDLISAIEKTFNRNDLWGESLILKTLIGDQK